MFKISFFSLIIILLVTSCSSEKDVNIKDASAAEIYSYAYQEIFDGNWHGKFHMSLFSKENRDLINSRLEHRIKSTGEDREELLEFYRVRKQNTAKCIPLTLLEERVKGNTTILLYKDGNTCYKLPDTTDTYRKIHMLNEDGWKIDEHEYISTVKGSPFDMLN